jgi:hypothetical protein
MTKRIAAPALAALLLSGPCITTAATSANRSSSCASLVGNWQTRSSLGISSIGISLERAGLSYLVGYSFLTESRMGLRKISTVSEVKCIGGKLNLGDAIISPAPGGIDVKVRYTR